MSFDIAAQAEAAAGGTRTAEQLLQHQGFPSRAAERVLVQSPTQHEPTPALECE